MSAPVPARLGDYAVIRHLARGGMADIYLARRTWNDMERLVVLKRIRPELNTDEAIVNMFLDEARLAAQLQHSNIARVYDIWDDEEDPFFAMEFLHGEDVYGVMERVGSRLPLGIALAIVSRVCAGLHHAHEKRDLEGRQLNIVHRDVSPQNVIVTYEGEVKVVDFGIAKAAVRAWETHSGEIKGKVRYMSPEQARGQPLDCRSDVFSTGILLWEVTTGQDLFRGGSDFDILNQIAHARIRPAFTAVPDYPKDLDAIVKRALERDPDKRYASAEDLQIAIEEFARKNQLDISSIALSRFMRERFAKELQAWDKAQADGLSLVEHVIDSYERIGAAPPPSSRVWLGATLLAVLLVTLVGGGVFLFWQKEPVMDPGASTEPMPATTPAAPPENPPANPAPANPATNPPTLPAAAGPPTTVNRAPAANKAPRKKAEPPESKPETKPDTKSEVKVEPKPDPSEPAKVDEPPPKKYDKNSPFLP